MLMKLLLLLLACASGLALADKHAKRTNQGKTQLGVALDDPDVLNREDSCPPDCPMDCKDLYDKGHKKDGVYVIYISTRNDDPTLVYCDMQTSGGGWTVFQKRSNGMVDFYRDWLEYDSGFGYLKSEHWLGLRKLYIILTQKNSYRLRVDMALFNRSTAYAEYSDFTIGSPSEKYRLGLSKFEGGTAGDSMMNPQYDSSKDLRGMMFSTKDQDNDKFGGDCAAIRHGAWWYNACAYSNLNAVYNTDVRQESWTNVFWLSFNGNYPLKSVSMKFRPM